MKRQPKVANFVAQRLMQEIAEQGLVVGDHLGAEHEIIERLGVARASVREGLRLLESFGVVELRRGAGGGVTISRPDPAALVTPHALMLQFEGGSLGDVIEAFTAIEPTVAALAAQRRSDQQLERLSVCVDTLRASIDDDLAFRRANHAFHNVMSEASGNALLGILMPSLSWMSTAIGWEIPASRRRRVAVEKASILEAIQRRDSLAASDRTRAMLITASGLRQANPRAFDAPIVWTHLNDLLSLDADQLGQAVSIGRNQS